MRGMRQTFMAEKKSQPYMRQRHGSIPRHQVLERERCPLIATVIWGPLTFFFVQSINLEDYSLPRTIPDDELKSTPSTSGKQTESSQNSLLSSLRGTFQKFKISLFSTKDSKDVRPTKDEPAIASTESSPRKESKKDATLMTASSPNLQSPNCQMSLERREQVLRAVFLASTPKRPSDSVQDNDASKESSGAIAVWPEWEPVFYNPAPAPTVQRLNYCYCFNTLLIFSFPFF